MSLIDVFEQSVRPTYEVAMTRVPSSKKDLCLSIFFGSDHERAAQALDYQAALVLDGKVKELDFYLLSVGGFCAIPQDTANSLVLSTDGDQRVSVDGETVGLVISMSAISQLCEEPLTTRPRVLHLAQCLTAFALGHRNACAVRDALMAYEQLVAASETAC